MVTMLEAKTPPPSVRAEATTARFLAAKGLERPPERLSIEIAKAARRLALVTPEGELASFPVGLGGAPEGAKLEEGDLKTPEGEYYVCTRNDRSRFHLFLGISYPGPEDAARGRALDWIDAGAERAILEAWRRRARPPWKTRLGGEVGIHGFGAGSDWTLGCIALEDEDVEVVWGLAPLGTRVRIVP